MTTQDIGWPQATAEQIRQGHLNAKTLSYTQLSKINYRDDTDVSPAVVRLLVALMGRIDAVEGEIESLQHQLEDYGATNDPQLEALKAIRAKQCGRSVLRDSHCVLDKDHNGLHKDRDGFECDDRGVEPGFGKTREQLLVAQEERKLMEANIVKELMKQGWRKVE